LGLTQNQFDLLRLYAHGLTVKEIAARQSRGMSTIYQSLQRIKARLNIERDADLIAFAIEHGLRSSTPSSPSTRCGTR
jgi:DNA-binding NarL/FixJ family response regulator